MDICCALDILCWAISWKHLIGSKSYSHYINPNYILFPHTLPTFYKRCAINTDTLNAESVWRLEHQQTYSVPLNFTNFCLLLVHGNLAVVENHRLTHIVCPVDRFQMWMPNQEGALSPPIFMSFSNTTALSLDYIHFNTPST